MILDMDTSVGEESVQSYDMMDIGLEPASWDVDYDNFLRSEVLIPGPHAADGNSHMQPEQLCPRAGFDVNVSICGGGDCLRVRDDGCGGSPVSVFAASMLVSDDAPDPQALTADFGRLPQLQDLEDGDQEPQVQDVSQSQLPLDGSRTVMDLSRRDFDPLLTENLASPAQPIANSNQEQPHLDQIQHQQQQQQQQRRQQQQQQQRQPQPSLPQQRAITPAATAAGMKFGHQYDSSWASVSNEPDGDNTLRRPSSSLALSRAEPSDIPELQAFQEQCDAQHQGPDTPKDEQPETRHQSLPVTLGMFPSPTTASKVQLIHHHAGPGGLLSNPQLSSACHASITYPAAAITADNSELFRAALQQPSFPAKQQARGQQYHRPTSRHGLPPIPRQRCNSSAASGGPTSSGLPSSASPAQEERYRAPFSSSAYSKLPPDGYRPCSTVMAADDLQPLQWRSATLNQPRQSTGQTEGLCGAHHRVAAAASWAPCHHIPPRQQQARVQQQQHQHQQCFDLRLRGMANQQQVLAQMTLAQSESGAHGARGNSEAVKLASPFESAAVAPEVATAVAGGGFVDRLGESLGRAGSCSMSMSDAAEGPPDNSNAAQHSMSLLQAPQVGPSDRSQHTSNTRGGSLGGKEGRGDRNDGLSCMSNGNSSPAYRPSLLCGATSPVSVGDAPSPSNPGSACTMDNVPAEARGEGNTRERAALSAALKRNASLNHRNQILEGFLGLLPPSRLAWPHGKPDRQPGGQPGGLIRDLKSTLVANVVVPNVKKEVSLFAKASTQEPSFCRNSHGSSFAGTSAAQPAGGGSLGNHVSRRHQSLQIPRDAFPAVPSFRRHSGDEPPGFRRASAGSNLPPNAQVAGLQVLNPVVLPGEEWWLQVEMSRGVPPPVVGLAPGIPPPRGALTFTLRPEVHLHLLPQQIAQLPWRNVCALWQELVTALAHCLATCIEQPGRRLTRLLLEAGQLCSAVAPPGRSPGSGPVCFLSECPPLPFPQPERWREIAASLLITPSAAGQLSDLRRLFLKARGAIHHRRDKLLGVIRDDKGGIARDCHGETLKALPQLTAILADEKALDHHFRAVVWGRILTPVQAALATVQLFPWSCDVNAIAEAVAAEMGEPTLKELLADGAALK